MYFSGHGKVASFHTRVTLVFTEHKWENVHGFSISSQTQLISELFGCRTTYLFHIPTEKYYTLTICLDILNS